MTSCPYHSKHHVLLAGEETSYATAVTATKDFGLVQSWTPTPNRAHTKVYKAGSRETQCVVAGQAEFGFEGEVHMQHGRLLYYALGSASHAETTGDYTHTFSIANNLPSLTIQDGYSSTSDVVKIYPGSKVNELTLSCEKDTVMTGKFSGMSKTVDTSESSASGAVISSIPVQNFKNLSFSVGASGAEADIGQLQSFNLTIANNMERENSTGSILSQELIEKSLDLSGDVTVSFDSATEYQRFLGGSTGTATEPEASPTPFSVVINSHNGTTLGSGRREFFIQLESVQYEDADQAVSVGDVIYQTFNFNATTLGASGAYFVDSLSDSSF